MLRPRISLSVCRLSVCLHRCVSVCLCLSLSVRSRYVTSLVRSSAFLQGPFQG